MTRTQTFRSLFLVLTGCFFVCLASGLCVAFVVVSLVPLRELVLPKLFSAQELAALDQAPALPGAGSLSVYTSYTCVRVTQEWTLQTLLGPGARGTGPSSSAPR